MADVTIFPKHGQPPIENNDKVVYHARKAPPRPLTDRPEAIVPPDAIEEMKDEPPSPDEVAELANMLDNPQIPSEESSEVANFKEPNETPESD